MTTQRGKERLTERMIVAILTSPTLREAAEQCGCSVRTLIRWRKHESFARQFEAAKAAMVSQATSKLRAEGGKAVDVLARVASDAEAPPGTRAIAARGLLELMLKAHETETLEQRIAALEQTLGGDDAITKFR